MNECGRSLGLLSDVQENCSDIRSSWQMLGLPINSIHAAPHFFFNCGEARPSVIILLPVLVVNCYDAAAC